MLSQPYFPKIAQRAGLIIALLVGVEACVDKEFELTKPINTQLNVHAKFDLWLGSTDTLRLGDDSLLGSLDSGLLVVNPDGSYSMKMSGDQNPLMPTFNFLLPIPACSSQDSVDINIDVDLEQSITVSPPVMVASVHFPSNLPPVNVPLPAFTIVAEDKNSTPFDINFSTAEFPSQVDTIHEISFRDNSNNSNGSLVSFTINLQGMHSAINAGTSGDPHGYRDTIKALTIKFPSIFQLAINPASVTRDYESLDNGAITLTNFPTTNKDSVVLNFFVKSMKHNFHGAIDFHDSIYTDLTYSLQTLNFAMLANSNPQMPLRFNIAAELHFDDVEVTTKPISVPVKGNSYEVASGLVDIPAQITCVNEVDFGSAVYLPFSVFSSGLPFAVQGGEIPIEFPKVLQFVAGQNSLTKNPLTNRWTYRLQAAQAFGSETYRDSLKLDIFEVSWTRKGNESLVALVDDSVSIADDSIVLAPKRAWANRLIAEANARNFWFNFELQKRELKPHSVTACLADNVVEAHKFAFPLDLPDMLRGDNVNLALQSPGIAFEVVNPMSIPLNVELAVSDGMGNEKSGTMHIDSAVGIGFPATSLIYMSGNQSDVPQGYEWVDINVADIIKSVPDSVFISATPTIANNSGSHRIYMSDVQHDTFKMHYDVNVPIAFDTGFRFAFSDTIAFDGIDLSSYKVDGTVEITAAISNSLPVGLTLELVAMDSLYGTLPNVLLKSVGDIPAGTVAAPHEGEFKISLTLNDQNQDDFGKVRAIFVRMTAKSSVPGKLNSEQYIVLSLGLMLDANVGVDLDKLQ